MAQIIRFSPPHIHLGLQDGDGATLLPPELAARVVTISQNQFISADVTPSAVWSSIDPVNGTESGFTSSQVSYNMDGFTAAKAYAVVLTGKKIVAATGLSANVVRMLAGGNEIARITVDSTTDTVGWYGRFGQAGDDRCILSGNATAITGGAIEADDNIFTKSAHGLLTGAPVTLTAITGGTGLTQGNQYFFHRLSANTGYLCATYAHALAGTPVEVTLDGSSVTLTPQTDLGFAIDTVDSNLLIQARLILSDQ